jgi:acyl carrier protein
MEREKIFNELVDFLKEALFMDSLIVKPDDNLTDDLGVDSMGAVDFINRVEEVYEISIDDDEMKDIETLNDAVSLVLNKSNNK